MPRRRPRRSTRALAGTLVVSGGILGLAYRFALLYRRRAGLPHPSPVLRTPADLGLPAETVAIPTPRGSLPGWFVPAQDRPGERDGRPAAAPRPARPGIVVVHGWESNRGRALAHVRYLHAAGFHCLVFDVRGHGDNPPEELPMTAAEFGADAAAAARWLSGRAEVSRVGILGHSFGAAGCLLAAAQEPAIGAVVAMSTPADPVQLTRETFRFAGVPLPRPLDLPLAWLTTRVLLAPRGHAPAAVSATSAVRRYGGPLLLVHGAQDRIVPASHLDRLARAAREARYGSGARVETLLIADYGHRWLYEVGACRRAVAQFFAAALDGPHSPDAAGKLAGACDVSRPAEPIQGFGAWRDAAGPSDGLRRLWHRPRPEAIETIEEKA